jgi:quinol monooxygenase YgiN
MQTIQTEELVMPIIAVATLRVKPESVDIMREILIGAIEEVHGEPGCQLYALHESGPTFVIIEQWADSEALRTHVAAPAATKLQAAQEHLDAPPDIRILDPLAAGDPEKGQLRR